MSALLFMTGLSSAIGEAFVALSAGTCVELRRRGTSSEVLPLITGFVFWWSVRDLDAKEDELNNLAEGHLNRFRN
ncbi:hypothetical protein BYT27DRAFT_7257567 [Phlegmacium glaucopus]|nr:hypothetical protein BYT27DRAFT_7257567 [Phlegmacium glaucopus]